MTADEARQRARARAGLNAFISLTEEDGPGPAIAVKDLIDVRGTVTTAGASVVGEPAADDAPAVRNARERGCVVMGKANLHEWALGATSVNRTFGPARNPHDERRVSGGSSGGSAAAVAAELCDWAIGTDTLGSIRIPSSLCGVAGLRPTNGSVSTERVVALSGTLDTVGPIARDLDTLAAALGCLTGSDVARPRANGAGGARLAYPRDWISGLDADVERGWERVVPHLEPIDFVSRDVMRDAATVITLYEAGQLHRDRIARDPDGYDPAVLADLKAGLEISEDAYRDAIATRQRVIDEAARATDGVDALVLPTTACVAPLIEEVDVREPLTRFTRPLSLLEGPMVSVPLKTDGLPVAIQLVGRAGGDAELLQIAADLAGELDASSTN